MIVSESKDIQSAIENARLTFRLGVIGGIISAGLLLLSAILGTVRGGQVLLLAVIPFSVALLFAVAAALYGMLRASAVQEEEEKLLLAKRQESRALDVEEDVRFTAGRSFAHYSKYAPYVFAILAAVLIGVLVRCFWNGGHEMAGSPIHTALIAAVMLLFGVFSGVFFIGQSRMPFFRWLRPMGAWLMTGGVVLGVAGITAIAFHNNCTGADPAAARVILWILAVLGAELILSFLIEFYRPRTGGEVRPVFESRLLALFTEPGGIMRNVAQALDYQFGFKVSGTWLYGFLERSFFPALLIWAVLFWSFTCVHEVGPDQVGVKEEFGCIVAKDLGPGIYWTLPAPFGRFRTFSCTEVRSVVVGEVKDETGKKKGNRVVLWTEAHGGANDHFIVAVRPEGGKNAAKEAASISFLRVSIPIQFRIREDGILDWGYRHEDPAAILRRIGEEAATEYFASSSMQEVMSVRREEAENAMKHRIQTMADEAHLGIEVLSVSMLDAHPPAEKVAPAYQEVIGAMEQKETAILEAQAYAAKLEPESSADAQETVEAAQAYQRRVKSVAAAEKERFQAQCRTYEVMPEMFRLRSYLEFLETEGAALRKYVISAGLKDEVYQLNFETKERLDLVDTDLTKLSDEK